MKKLYFLTLLLLAQSLFAQNKVEEAINKDVWYNFMQAYQDLDASLFNQIHTNDVLRVPADQNEMLIGQEYKDKNLDTFNRWNAQRVRQKIEFSFYKRIQKKDWAYEIGIFKLTRFNGRQSKSYYGKFNVTLKRISGIWKIYIDSDTNEERSIDESHFQKGDILEY